jgi:predicted O-linked N-acetylglucosamine transferase (SPINDLY family)
MDEINQNNAVNAFNLANSAYKEGDIKKAFGYTQEALAFEPEFEFAALLQARCQVLLGDVMGARASFAQTLRLNSANYSAWLEAGHLCRQIGELQQAALSYQKAIDVDPQRYEALLSIARVLGQQGHLEMAQMAYNDASIAATATLSSKPDGVYLVHWKMGQYWLELGHPEFAQKCFLSALVLFADQKDEISKNKIAEVRMDWALALLRQGDRNGAMQMLTLASDATDESTLARLVSLSFRNNFWQEALVIARRSVELYPESKNSRWNLAHLLTECWQMKEALEVLSQAEALGDVPGSRSLRASTAGRTGDVDTALDLYRELAREDRTFSSSAAMSSLYTDKLSAQEVADLHRELFASWGEGARSHDSFVRQPLQGRRLKVGIVSADFHHQHPVNIFMQPILRELDKTKIELYMYFTGISHDEQTLLARSRVEHWVESSTLNNTQLSRRIDTDEIDVLIDMAGHTGLHRMELFAKRAAPVQVTYLGYPGSTGVPNIDYILGDDIVTPMGCERLYSEKVHRLPGAVFCYAPEEDYPYPVYDKSTQERVLTFGSFNNVPKLTPHTLKLWARILREVPNSRLLLKAPSFSDEGAIDLFRERLKALNVDLSRVEFRGPVGLSDMMAEYGDVDIALDPVPYNGGTTTLQAMWMGVPVVTKRGDHFVSRMGASFMSSAGLAQWVAKDDDEYVAIAKKMAKDRKKLLEIKKDLRKNQLSKKAWDMVAHTRAIEDFLLSLPQG